MERNKSALVASWKRRSDQDMKAAGLTDFAIAGRYPESDQWIDGCDTEEWMATTRHACDFIWGKIRDER